MLLARHLEMLRVYSIILGHPRTIHNMTDSIFRGLIYALTCVQNVSRELQAIFHKPVYLCIG